MANQLKMAMVNAVWTLKQRGWSNRRIARELGIDRETVARYVHLWQADSKPATVASAGMKATSLLREQTRGVIPPFTN